MTKNKKYPTVTIGIKRNTDYTTHTIHEVTIKEIIDELTTYISDGRGMHEHYASAYIANTDKEDEDIISIQLPIHDDGLWEGTEEEVKEALKDYTAEIFLNLI